MAEVAKVAVAEVKEEKAKKVTAREVIRAELAEILKREKGLEKIARTKEGLVLVVGEETVVIRVILKKEKIEANEILETL
jgi:hypothetical protein